jgi:hypothetical protein
MRSRQVAPLGRDKFKTMFAARVLAILAAFALLASGAELKGTWSATSQAGNLAGSWTAQPDQSGGVTGTWMLQDATGRILMQGGWAASKSAQFWDGGWRANVSGRAGEYSGTWTSATSLSPQARFADMLESALRAVVTGTWKSGPRSGAWSIRSSL